MAKYKAILPFSDVKVGDEVPEAKAKELLAMFKVPHVELVSEETPKVVLLKQSDLPDLAKEVETPVEKPILVKKGGFNKK